MTNSAGLVITNKGTRPLSSFQRGEPLPQVIPIGTVANLDELFELDDADIGPLISESHKALPVEILQGLIGFNIFEVDIIELLDTELIVVTQHRASRVSPDN